MPTVSPADLGASPAALEEVEDGQRPEHCLESLEPKLRQGPGRANASHHSWGQICVYQEKENELIQ